MGVICSAEPVVPDSGDYICHLLGPPPRPAPQSHLESSQHPVFHHPDELLMAEAVVPVHVEQLKDGVQNVIREIVTGGDLHSSLELGCGSQGWG